MEFPVEFAAQAVNEIDRIVSRIWQDAPLNAVRWQEQLREKIQQLTFLPDRFALAAESLDAPIPVRQIFFGKYRVLYTIKEHTVFVLAVRHGHRLPVTLAEIRRRLER